MTKQFPAAVAGQTLAAPHLKPSEENENSFGDAATPAQESFFSDVLTVQNHPFEHYRADALGAAETCVIVSLSHTHGCPEWW